MTTVWDEMRIVLARNLRPVVLVGALAIVLPTIVSGIAGLWQQEQPADTATAGAALVGLVGIAGTVAIIWGSLSLTALALGAGGAGTALSAGAARLPRMLLVVAVLGVAIVLLTLPLFVILAAAGIDLAQMAVPGASIGMTPGAALATMAYLLVLLPLALVMLARIALISPLVVAERRHVGAIAASWRLTRGLTLKLVGVLLLYFVVSAILFGAARFVLGSLLLLAFGDGSALNGATVAATVVDALLSGGLSVVSTLFVATLYRLIVRREDAAPGAAAAG